MKKGKKINSLVIILLSTVRKTRQEENKLNGFNKQNIKRKKYTAKGKPSGNHALC